MSIEINVVNAALASVGTVLLLVWLFLYVKGKDINYIETSNKENYSKALEYAHILRLKDIPYDKALKLTVNYLNRLNKISKSN